MPDGLHHLPTTSTAKARALSKTWRLLLAPPPALQRPRRPTHRAPPAPPTHTGNVGVMTNTSTQPIGNALIDSILHQR